MINVISYYYKWETRISRIIVSNYLLAVFLTFTGFLMNPLLAGCPDPKPRSVRLATRDNVSHVTVQPLHIPAFLSTYEWKKNNNTRPNAQPYDRCIDSTWRNNVLYLLFVFSFCRPVAYPSPLPSGIVSLGRVYIVPLQLLQRFHWTHVNVFALKQSRTPCLLDMYRCAQN